MKANLFYKDTLAVLNSGELREAARREVETSSLICRSAQGDRKSAMALHKGFWPFVREFEIAIDKHKFGRGLLEEKFGVQKAHQVLRGLFLAVREMKTEEGSHAVHWRKDAECLGILEIEGPQVSRTAELIKDAYHPDPTRFFSVLAGIEFIAEELSRFLVSQSAFTSLFSRRRWVWGEVHLIPHDDRPSHVEIDLDLARAYAPQGYDILQVRTMVLDTIRLFARAARDVAEAYA
jgi:hypothetical protein